MLGHHDDSQPTYIPLHLPSHLNVPCLLWLLAHYGMNYSTLPYTPCSNRMNLWNHGQNQEYNFFLSCFSQIFGHDDTERVDLVRFCLLICMTPHCLGPFCSLNKPHCGRSVLFPGCGALQSAWWKKFWLPAFFILLSSESCLSPEPRCSEPSWMSVFYVVSRGRAQALSVVYHLPSAHSVWKWHSLLQVLSLRFRVITLGAGHSSSCIHCKANGRNSGNTDGTNVPSSRDNVSHLSQLSLLASKSSESSCNSMIKLEACTAKPCTSHGHWEQALLATALSVLPLHLLRQGLLQDLWLHHLAKLTGQGALWNYTHLYLPCHPWDFWYTPPCPTFTWVLGTQIQGLVLVWQVTQLLNFIILYSHASTFLPVRELLKAPQFKSWPKATLQPLPFFLSAVWSWGHKSNWRRQTMLYSKWELDSYSII